MLRWNCHKPILPLSNSAATVIVLQHTYLLLTYILIRLIAAISLNDLAFSLDAT